MVALQGIHADTYMTLPVERRIAIDDWLILHGLFGPDVFAQAILGYESATKETAFVFIDKGTKRWIERIVTDDPPPLLEGSYA